MSEKELFTCRYCKQKVPKGIARCPYCGTFNPTMDTKRSLKWTIGAIVVLYLAGYLYHVAKG